MPETPTPVKRIPAGVSGKPTKAPRPAWTDEQRNHFLTTAEQALPITIAGQAMMAERRQFTTGSCGYNANGKVVIGGLTYQVSLNLTAVGSKPE